MSGMMPRNVVRSTFAGSSFGNAQLELFLQRLVVTQFKINPDVWTPFTWEDYVERCDHLPLNAEHEILDAMVVGGEVQLNDMGTAKSVTIAGGYLSKEGDKYVIADGILKTMAPFAQAV